MKRISVMEVNNLIASEEFKGAIIHLGSVIAFFVGIGILGVIVASFGEKVYELLFEAFKRLLFYTAKKLNNTK